MLSVIRTIGAAGFVLALSGALASAATPQTAVGQADIQRLQDRVYDAGTEIARLRAQNADRAARLQDELDELREEVVYLKVKLRKDGTISRSEYSSLRDRIDQLASRARDESGGAATGTGGGASAGAGSGVSGGTTGGASGSGAGGATGTRRQSGRREVPAGQELDVRLQTELNSDTAKVEDRFEATTAVDLSVDGDVVIPAGSVLRGVVTAVENADRLKRKGRLSLSFDQIGVNGRSYPIRATVTQALESEGIRGEAERIGAGAGVGAIIGGILGGLKGALAGILIGGGGVVAATEGKDVVLPAGTVLRIRLDSPLVLR